MIKINKFSVLKRMYKMAYENHWGHLASSTSALPIMIDIYENMTDRDYFVLSKGHAGMALYALLQELGYNPNTKYPYPVFQPTEGINITGGSLGHGLPFSAGLAFGLKLKEESNPHKSNVYCLVGDGELQEGTTWETYLLMYKFHLKNLFVTIDANDWQACKPCYDIPATEIYNKLGFQCVNSEKGMYCSLTKGRPFLHTFYMSEEDYKTVLKDIEIQENKQKELIGAMETRNKNYNIFKETHKNTLKDRIEKIKIKNTKRK